MHRWMNLLFPNHCHFLASHHCFTFFLTIIFSCRISHSFICLYSDKNIFISVFGHLQLVLTLGIIISIYRSHFKCNLLNVVNVVIIIGSAVFSIFYVMCWSHCSAIPYSVFYDGWFYMFFLVLFEIMEGRMRIAGHAGATQSRRKQLSTPPSRALLNRNLQIDVPSRWLRQAN